MSVKANANRPSPSGHDAAQQQKPGKAQAMAPTDSERRHLDEALDEALIESFPTSDPPSPFVPERQRR